MKKLFITLMMITGLFTQAQSFDFLCIITEIENAHINSVNNANGEATSISGGAISNGSIYRTMVPSIGTGIEHTVSIRFPGVEGWVFSLWDDSDYRSQIIERREAQRLSVSIQHTFRSQVTQHYAQYRHVSSGSLVRFTVITTSPQ